MIQIPKQPNQFTLPTWNQNNDSDFNGSLWSSFNLDVSENEGKLRLGKRLLLATGQVDDADMSSYPSGYRNFSDNAGTANFTVMGSYVWRGFDLADTAAAKDTHTSPPSVDSTISDIETFNNELYVTASDGNAYYLTSSSLAWTAVSGLAHGSSPCSLCIYGGKLYCGGSTRVFSMDTSHTTYTSGASSVQIPDYGIVITFIRAASNRIWIGTVNVGGGKAYVYEWDGTATQVTKSYRLESSGALACVIKDDIPYIMDSNGALLTWNGGTFVRLAKLYRRNTKLLKNTTSASNNRFIHPNGMSIIQGRINILINGVNNSGETEEVIASGIWEYDENKGLVHKHSFGQTKDNGTIADYGQVRISGVGALTEFNATNSNGFFAGATYFSDATTTKGGLFYNDLTDIYQKAGYFITPKLSAIDENGQPSIKNTWNGVYAIYRKFLDANDKIVIKYRTSEVAPVEATITWASTTTFTVPNSSVVVSNYWTSGTGGEVEILNGVGGGKCSHITNAVLAAGTWTVTVDETYTGATGTAKARFQNWVKISSITNQNEIYDQSASMSTTSWIQFKVWMLFTGKDELEKLLVMNSNSFPAH